MEPSSASRAEATRPSGFTTMPLLRPSTVAGGVAASALAGLGSLLLGIVTLADRDGSFTHDVTHRLDEHGDYTMVFGILLLAVGAALLAGAYASWVGTSWGAMLAVGAAVLGAVLLIMLLHWLPVLIALVAIVGAVLLLLPASRAWYRALAVQAKGARF